MNDKDRFIKSESRDEIQHIEDEQGSIKTERKEEAKAIDPEIQTENLLQHMKTKMTTVRHARGIVVGCTGAGKTTLLYRLMGRSLKEIKEIESTLGLQVYEHIFTVQDKSFQATDHHYHKPLIRIPISSLKKNENDLSDKKTMMDKDSFPKKEDIDDLPTEMVGSNPEVEDYIAQVPVSGDESNLQKCTIIEIDEELGDVGKCLNLPTTNECKVNEASITNMANNTEQKTLKTQVEDIVSKTLSPEVIRKILDAQENEISISMIDFAGQFSYYASHQIYMRSKAFYILVMDMTKGFEEVVSGKEGEQTGSVFSTWKYKEYVEFWLNSICSFGGPKAPVLVVATHAEGKTEDDIEEFFQCLWRSLPKTIKSWLSSDSEFAFGLLYVSEEETAERLQILKNSIVDLVSHKLNTKIEVPSSWALLEHLLQNWEKPIISCDEIQDLNEQLPEEYRLECNEEIPKFLSFFHDHGLLLYFKGEATCTHAILNIQWFSDAFSKLVADKKHINKVCRRELIEEWGHFNQTGELNNALVDALWKGKNIKSYQKYKKELMAYMERLRMLVSISDADEAQSWYVPCMNKKRFKTDIIKSNLACSSILCFRFTSFAMFVFYRLVAYCMIYLKWNVVPDKEGKCLFQTAAMFEYKNHTVLLGIRDKDIQLQIMTNSSDIDISVSYEIGITIHKAIEELTKTFSEDKFLNFQKGYKCEDKFCDQNDTSFTPEENLCQLETENIECSCCPMAEKHQINIHRTRRYWEKETLSTSITSGQDLSGRTRFAKLGMATNDVLNKVYRDILESEIPPSDIEKEVNSSSDKKRMNLNPYQEDLLKKAKINGYKEFDISLTYKMIRNICSTIPKPTKGKWGDEPAAGEVTVGDDVERIRSIRNGLTAHVSSALTPQKEFDDTWFMMSDICKRLENFTGKKYLGKLIYIQKLTLREEEEDNIIEKVKMESQHEMVKEMWSDVKELKEAVMRSEAKHASNY